MNFFKKLFNKIKTAFQQDEIVITWERVDRTAELNKNYDFFGLR